MDYSPPGSSVHGILQARNLEWVAIPFSRGSSQPRDQIWVFCIDTQILYHRTTREALKEGFDSLKYRGTVTDRKWVLIFVTPWTVPCWALLTMEFFRQEHWSGLPFPSPEDLPNPGIELRSSAL